MKQIAFIRKNIQSILLLVATAFFTALLFYVNSNPVISAFSYKDNTRAFYKGEQGVALTFDINWGDENAEAIIDVLDKEKFHSATFFLSGAWIERHQHIVEKLIERKFEIGILGYNYQDYTGMSEEEIVKDMSEAIVICEKVGIEKVSLVRAPTGTFDEKALKAASRLGLTMVSWSVDPSDWKNPGTEKILNVVGKADEGDIVLLHASDSALQTAKALPQIFDLIYEKELTPLTVSEMLANGKAKTKEISFGD